MGIGLGGSSASVYDGYERTSEIEPNPKNFNIIYTEEIGNNLVAMITYPNCTTYEGKKILVYKNTTGNQLRKESILDPHFSDKGLAPFARFEPTETGLIAARIIARQI